MTTLLSPIHTALLMRRGQRLFQQGQPEPALKVFQQFAQRDPKDGYAQNSAPQLWSGMALAELCRWNQAQAAFQSAADLDPGDPVKPAFLARNWLDQGQPHKALAILQPLVESNPHPVDILSGLYGLALLQTDQVETGCQILLGLPRPIRPLWLATRILSAVEQRLLKRLDDSFPIDKNLVCDHPAGQGEKLADARQAFTLRIRARLRPRSTDVYQDQALFQAEMQLKTGAVEEAGRALAPLEDSPIDDPSRLVRCLRLLLMARLYAPALKKTEAALLDPRLKDAAILRVLQAISLLYMHRTMEARAILADVYAKGGTYGFVEYSLGLCQLAEAGSRISAEDLAAVRARFAKVLREYILYNQTDVCRLRLAELARLAGTPD